MMPACAGGELRVPALPAAVADLEESNRAGGDPYAGRFPVEEALDGLGEGRRLYAEIATDAGTIHCRLDTNVPLTLANFVGLARGKRPFLGPEGAWIRAPYYDGSPWHRAIEDQFVQTGRHGSLDGPGYALQDEMTSGHVFDRGGILAMANRGAAHTAGAQFFITTRALPELKGQYTIFGSCDDEHVVRELESKVIAGETPTVQTVTISRR